jgi:ribonuclease HI
MILSRLKKIFIKHKFECYFDASFSKKESRGAFYIVSNGKLIKMSARNMNCISSDMAEAEILHGLLEYISQKIPQGSTVYIYGDAKTVIDGATGRCSKSKRYHKLYMKYKALSKQYRLCIEYIPREQNKLADQLSKNKFKDFKNYFTARQEARTLFIRNSLKQITA